MKVRQPRSAWMPALFLLLAVAGVRAQTPVQTVMNENFARDPRQPIDQAYTDKIKQYTTEPQFVSPLVSYLPASKTVPTPEKVLGDVSGAPNMLPYAEDVYKYFRLLEKSSPRVRVVTIGHSEEGREMIAAAIADESLLKEQKENDERLAKLADPRSIGLDDAKAQPLIDKSFPVYYITGTIHSTETGAPTALMELAYRLAVDDSPYIKYIRSHLIVLITPVVEVDGRDRMVDLYKWHRAHPKEDYPRLTYWGHYVAHDNNRDAMGMTLNLTNNVLSTFIGWHAQVLHDLHESVPFLYDNTVGDGPYNPWIDPTLADEWAELGWNNVAQMQTFGMPGVFTHGDFDTWSPGYLMFLGGLHNGISRLYETFGNGGADTEKRILTPEEYSRTWYRQNPPPPVVMWSQRDNNNYEQTALLTTLSYFSHNTHHFLENYYTKSKRSIQKPLHSGPAAYVLPADAAELNRQLQLLKTLQLQHVEISQLTAGFTGDVTVPKTTAPTTTPSNPPSDTPAATPSTAQTDAQADARLNGESDTRRGAAASAETHSDAHEGARAGTKTTTQTFPAGSYVVRMDQPYSRIADALLDKEYWAPDDPQKHPYDDTGWSFPELFNVKVVRLTEPAILKATMKSADLGSSGKLQGSGSIFAIANSGQTSLLALLYELKGAKFQVTEKPFDSDGAHFAPGSLLVSDVDEGAFTEAAKKLDLDGARLQAMPSVATHAVMPPRIAFMHTWLATQTEGWWRLAFDKLGIPYSYISTQTAGSEADLRGKYDVIVFAPVGRSSSQEIINGMPMWGNPLPWQKTELTPNLGLVDSTPDTRPGLGYDGLDHLKTFVSKGGLLITCEDTAEFAIDTGLAPGVSVLRSDARVVGTVLSSVFVSPSSPIANGYGAMLPVMSANGMAFNVSDTLGGRSGRTLMDPYAHRPTGRGGPDEADVPQGRAIVNPQVQPKTQPWEARPLNEEQRRNNPQVIPAALRPQVILRFSDAKGLLLSGLLDKGTSIAEHAIVVDAHLGEGNVLLFANNPVYRGETIGSYNLVFNAILSYDHLNRPADSNGKEGSKEAAAAE